MRKSIWTALFSVVGLMAAAVVGLLVPSSASAATPSTCGTYPVGTGASIAVSATSVNPGDKITVTGQGFDPGATVALTLYPKSDPSAVQTIKTVTASSKGKFRTFITMPLDAVGNQILTANGNAQCPADPVQIFVKGAGASGSPTGTGSNPGTPAMTGVDVALLIVAAGVLLGAGVIFTRGGRRRASHT
jgi:hypothetical protein